jgi:DNA-binding NtrC family response regulator
MADIPGTKKRARILLIDDDPIFGRIMTVRAELDGIDLTYIPSVRDVYHLSKWEFDIAIVDYDLGIVNGIQLGNYFEDFVHPISILLTSAQIGVETKKWPVSIKGYIDKKAGAQLILKTALSMVH